MRGIQLKGVSHPVINLCKHFSVRSLTLASAVSQLNSQLESYDIPEGTIITFRDSSSEDWLQYQFQPEGNHTSVGDTAAWSRVGEIPDSFGGGCVYPERYSSDFYQGLLKALQVAKSEGRTTIDCTFFTGSWEFADVINIDFPVTIIFGSSKITTHGANFFNIKSNNVKIVGANRQTDYQATDTNVTELIMLSRYSATNESNTGYHIYSRGNKNCQYKDLVLRGEQTSTGRQVGCNNYPIDGCGGIFIEKADPSTTASGNTVNATVIDNVMIHGTKGAGIYMDTPILSLIRNVRVSSAGGHGIFIKDGTSTVLESCYVASARYAGFCISGLTYGAVINSVAEVCGCGWWIRSCTNVSFFSPGVETTYNYGKNPWSSAYRETGRYGLGMSTKAGDGISDVKITDVPDESWAMGSTNIHARDLFIGYAFVVTGGRNINIFTPYCISIANELSPNNPILDNVKDDISNMLIMGNCRALTVTNALFTERSGSNIPIVARYEIRIASTVSNLDLSYNPSTSYLPHYTSPTPITDNESLTAPIFNQSQSAIIHCGNKYYTKVIFTDIETTGSAYFQGQIITDTGIITKGPIIDYNDAKLHVTATCDPYISLAEDNPTEVDYNPKGTTIKVQPRAMLALDDVTEKTTFNLYVDNVNVATQVGAAQPLQCALSSSGTHTIRLEGLYEEQNFNIFYYVKVKEPEGQNFTIVWQEPLVFVDEGNNRSVKCRVSLQGNVDVEKLTQIGFAYSPSNQAPTESNNAIYYGSSSGAQGTIADNLIQSGSMSYWEYSLNVPFANNSNIRYIRPYVKVAGEAYSIYGDTYKVDKSDNSYEKIA